MVKSVLLRAVAGFFILFLFNSNAFAQNKDIDKGKESLTKAMEQKDQTKRQELIQKAKEDFQKGGMKTPEVAVLIGDAYLEKGDLPNAVTQYNGASKADKKEGFKKVADAYVENAFSGDEKNEGKAINKAMDLYRKSDAVKEGAVTIGDKYYDKGTPAAQAKALDYYILGGADTKLQEIADGLYAKGGDDQLKAAEVFMRLKSPMGYQKAGDIYYDHKEYQKAVDAYIDGKSVEGIKKYANYLYAQNRNDEADNLYVKLGEIMGASKDDAALEKLANECMSKGSYSLAARVYDKAGNTSMSDKCMGYAELISLNLDSAKMYFTSVGDNATIKTINDNTKILQALKDIGENLDQVQKLAPYVSVVVDSVAGTSTPSESDQKTQEDYYKSVRDQIIKNVYDVSANMAKLTNAELRKFVRMRFLHYGAVRKILDTDSFAIKKQKLDIKTKDVIL